MDVNQLGKDKVIIKLAVVSGVGRIGIFNKVG